MTKFKTPLEIYALLPKTNCGDCGIATCLAFAAAVLKEAKRPAGGPRLDPENPAPVTQKIARTANLARL